MLLLVTETLFVVYVLFWASEGVWHSRSPAAAWRCSERTLALGALCRCICIPTARSQNAHCSSSFWTVAETSAWLMESRIAW